jgi:transposase-like protein
VVLFLPVANVELNMPRLSLEKRRQIVDLVKDGNTYASISRRVPCSLDSVRRWAPLAVLEGLSDSDLKDQPRPGANPRFDVNTAYTAKRMATRGGGTTRSIAANMGGVRISQACKPK